MLTNTRPPWGWTVRVRFLGPLGLFLSLMACSSSTGPTVTLWEGSLNPIPPSQVTGNLAAISQFGGTEASIGMREGESGITYAWRIVSGTCQAPGEVQGHPSQYPPLYPDESGEASEDVRLAGKFKTGSRFATRVFRTLEGGELELVACGELHER